MVNGDYAGRDKKKKFQCPRLYLDLFYQLYSSEMFASSASKSTLNMPPQFLVHTLSRVASLIPTGGMSETPRVLCSYVSSLLKVMTVSCTVYSEYLKHPE